MTRLPAIIKSLESKMKARKATADLIRAKPTVSPKLMHQARTAVEQFKDLNSSQDAEALWKKDF